MRLLAQPTPSAEDRFLALSARSWSIFEVCSGSRADSCEANSDRLRGADSVLYSVLLLGLRIPGILEVCGAFGWRVLGEDFAAGVGDGLVSSRSDLSQQGLELGEDLLDWVEV
jgi:hypothetical protein